MSKIFYEVFGKFEDEDNPERNKTLSFGLSKTREALNKKLEVLREKHPEYTLSIKIIDGWD